MKVVSNASPLINLARIGKLGLLRDLYEELTIPDAVWREVVLEGAGQPGADEIESAAWILRQAAGNRELVRALRFVSRWDGRPSFAKSDRVARGALLPS